ncbi:lipopolysaccharide heptosyltransferase I [Zavarzinia sp. CC-PAN008]|uniref:lipopolysaccharide heptosyltransferase I n=1 Tax=Zavarzinia sp. CC-PAN008 TaxID=3243332 RepID=UPI003F748145
MRVLLVKTSSLGDIVHTFPAVTDALAAHPGLEIDWVVEEAFVPLVDLHRGAVRAVPVAYRRWRRTPLKGVRSGALAAFRARIAATVYDAVIDAQGLYKSAAITWMARGPKHGFDLAGAREKLAPFAVQYRHALPRQAHAVTRLRHLFAAALGHAVPDGAPDFGLGVREVEPLAPYLVGLHGTAWQTKEWPIARWRQVGQLAGAAGYALRLPWGSAAEERRARRIAHGIAGVEVLPRLDLAGMARLLAGATGVIAADTGLAHLAAALGVPTVVLFGPTDPARTGPIGRRNLALRTPLPCAPCGNRICNRTGNPRVEAPCMAALDPDVALTRLLALAADPCASPS